MYASPQRHAGMSGNCSTIDSMIGRSSSIPPRRAGERELADAVHLHHRLAAELLAELERLVHQCCRIVEACLHERHRAAVHGRDPQELGAAELLCELALAGDRRPHRVAVTDLREADDLPHRAGQLVQVVARLPAELDDLSGALRVLALARRAPSRPTPRSSSTNADVSGSPMRSAMATASAVSCWRRVTSAGRKYSSPASRAVAMARKRRVLRRQRGQPSSSSSTSVWSTGRRRVQPRSPAITSAASMRRSGRAAARASSAAASAVSRDASCIPGGTHAPERARPAGAARSARCSESSGSSTLERALVLARRLLVGEAVERGLARRRGSTAARRRRRRAQPLRTSGARAPPGTARRVRPAPRGPRRRGGGCATVASSGSPRRASTARARARTCGCRRARGARR